MLIKSLVCMILMNLKKIFVRNQIKLAQISNTVLFLKETISQLSEDKKILDDFNWLKKRVENLSSSFVNIKPDDINSSSTKHVHMDVSRFVDAQTYNDFVKNYNKEIDRVNWRLDELKLMVDDIITSLTNKVTDKDLKTLEGILLLIKNI